MNNLNLKKTQVAYAGDDLNDLILKNNVSLFISPANADKTIRKKSNILLKNKGGNGAVREIAELILNAQKKLDTAQSTSNEILDQAKKDSDRLIIELNDKFHKSSEIKKNSAESKITQMKDTAIKDIKNASIKIAIESVKRIITTSVDKSKLDALFQKNLDETNEELKKNNS